jgi:cell division protein FtsW
MTERAIKAGPIAGESRVRRLILGIDPWLILLIVMMSVFGLVIVYSASWDVSWRLFQDPNTLFRLQLGHLGLGILAMLVTTWFPFRWLRKLALPLIVGTILILLAVLIVNWGSAHRRSFLSGSIQPSEMAKLALIIYLAVWMESKGEKLADVGYGFWPLIMIMGLVGGLVLMQPDLSAGITIGIVVLTMFYLAGARMWQVLTMAVSGGALALMLVRVTQVGQDRWQKFIGGLVDVEQASYHVQQSLQSFYSGGFLGRGLGASRGKFGFLPAPHTDSIFAVVGEELGLVGAMFVLVLFCLLIWRGFRVAQSSITRLEALLVSGVVFWIGTEALINMSVLLGLLPFAGNALPFFSYGGSSLLTTLAGIGFVLNASRRSQQSEEMRGDVANLDLSRRYGRRSVSRLGRGGRSRKRS